MDWSKDLEMLIAPFISTPIAIASRMLDLAKLEDGETLIDLGCGDGRIVIIAERDYGAKAVGVDLNTELITYASATASNHGLKAQFIRGNLLDTDVSQADVLTLYLGTEANEFIRPKLEAELRIGTRIVTHDYPMVGWLSDYSEEIQYEGSKHVIFLYRWKGREFEEAKWKKMNGLLDLDVDDFRDVS